MPHIDYDNVATLDALINISDAAARASLVRLRERLQAVDETLEERLIFDSAHQKPAIAFYRGEDALVHLYPEPNVRLGLRVALPLRASERSLLDLRGISDRVREAVERGRPRHNTVWVEMVLRSPAAADELVDLLARRLDLLPRVH